MVPMLLFIFVEHFDVVDSVEGDDLDLVVLDDVLHHDVVRLCDGV